MPAFLKNTVIVAIIEKSHHKATLHFIVSFTETH